MTAAAEALVLAHLGLVEQVAARVARRMPPWIEMTELISLGNVGLVEAANRFDPEKHYSFAVWAMLRIRGAMIDAYRGRNYPRLMEPMPPGWMGDEQVNERNQSHDVPEVLVDRRSALDALIEKEQSVVVSIDAVRARKKLDRIEGRVFDRHVAGESMREIGKRHGKSGAWSHYVVHRAKQKMRLELVGKEDKAA